MKTDLFQSCGYCWVFQICWHVECSSFTASSFRIWNSSTGITSPPLALFVVVLPKPTWLHIPGCLALGGWSHHRGYLGHEDILLRIPWTVWKGKKVFISFSICWDFFPNINEFGKGSHWSERRILGDNKYKDVFNDYWINYHHQLSITIYNIFRNTTIFLNTLSWAF